MTRRYLLVVLLITALAISVTGCGDPDVVAPRSAAESDTTRITQRLGEPRDGFPNYEERAVLYLTNRARTEPDAFNADEPYEPSPPLGFDLELTKAARWQAEHIVEQSCWCEDHSSCCDMEPADEGGQCAGASGSCGATDSAERVGYWSSLYSGENAARGYASAPDALDGWIHSSGHWQNINSARHTLLGPGNHGTGWVQDFGAGSAPPPLAADGIHLGARGSRTFGITYFQPSTGGPQTIMAIVDGQCHDLDLAYGTPEHGAFETSVSLETGCHRYYFHITDGEGTHHTYPSQGSLGVSVGSTDDCPLFSDNRPADTCSPTGQGCETGHTRPCYTGPWGTGGVGICERGVERCIGGQWTGECRNEVHPEPQETCENGIDDDCNGLTDDGCGEAPDAGGGADAGSPPDTGGQSGDESCSQSRLGRPTPGASIVVSLLVVILASRRPHPWSSDA